MVVPLSWYARLYEHGESVTVTFTPYDTTPSGDGGGAVVVAGNYDGPSAPTRLLQPYLEIIGNAGNAGSLSPVPPGWWTTGRWHSGPAVLEDPIQLRLNLDSYAADEYDRTIDLSMFSWDGSPNIGRSIEPGIATTVLGMLNKIGTVSSVPFVAGPVGGLSGPSFAGQYWPQLQGTVVDILKLITSGTGISVSYAPAGGAIAGYASAGRQVIRLINPTHNKRTVVRASFVPQVKVACYNITHGVNKVIYAAPDVIQVTSGQNQDISVPLTCTPIFSNITQPVSVGAIPVIPYNGPNSIYCVYDSTGFEAHNVWNAFGGRIVVEAGSTPDEMIMHIIAPFDPNNPEAVYTIAEDQNPALYISAPDSAQFHKQDFLYNTGAVPTASQYRPEDFDVSYFDNVLCANQSIAHDRAVAYMAKVATSSLTIDSVTFESGVLRNPVTGVEAAVDPASLADSKFRAHGSMWRFTNLKYDKATGWDGAAAACTTVGDFDAEYAGMTLQQFQDELVLRYPDASAPTFGNGVGQLPTGTPLSGSLNLIAPTLEQFGYEPLRSTSV